MNNKMVLGIIIVYAFILSIVLVFQVAKRNVIISSPSNVDEINIEDRLNSAVVFYEDSPVIIKNKEQIIIDKHNPQFTPIFENKTAYVPLHFFKSAYNANVSSDNANCSVTIRLDNQALVIDKEGAALVDSIDDKKIQYNNKIFVNRNTIYVPIEVFSEAFNKNVYYYDNMVIVSNIKNIFGKDEDAQFINSLKNQVNDLPYIANEGNIREIMSIIDRSKLLDRVARFGNDGKKDDNNQVVNLITSDESNIAKNDNKYIYYLNDNNIYIVDYITNEVINKLSLEDGYKPNKIFLQDNYLIAIGCIDISNEEIVNNEVMTVNDNTIIEAYLQKALTTNNLQQPKKAVAKETEIYSRAYIFDVSDVANVLKVREFEVNGQYVDSIKNGDYIYMLAQLPVEDSYKNGKYYPPKFRDSLIGDKDNSIPFGDIQYFPELASRDYTIIASINIKDITKPSNIKAYLCAGDNIYLSPNNLYIAKNRFSTFDTDVEIENTYIYRMSLSEGMVISNGKGNVKGYVLDNGSMYENSGYFSIVTDYKEKSKNISNIYILNNDMKIAGQANKIADNANIKTAIFTDDKIFLIPKEKGEAMYLIDISNPVAPIGNGVLKLSMGDILIYPYNEEHILTVDNGNGVLKLTAYNITDKDKPVAMYIEELGKDNITTSLFSNTSFFSFDKEKNVFILPVTIEDSQSKNVTFSGGYVYRLDLDDGFNRLGIVSNEDENNLELHKIKGNFYSLSSKSISIIDIKDLENVKNIALE